MIQHSYTAIDVTTLDPNGQPNPYLPVFHFERWEKMLNEAAGGGTLESRDADYAKMFETWKNYKHNLPKAKRELTSEQDTITNLNLRRQTLAKQSNHKKDIRRHTNRKRS